MRKPTTALLALIATFGAGAATAQAAAIPVSTLLADFNAITEGNLTTTNDIVGPVLIGGDLRDTSRINSHPVVPLPVPVTGLGEVNVFGNVVGTTVSGIPTVGTNSVVLVGGTNPTSPSSVQATFPGKNTVSSVLSGNPFPFNFANDIWAQLNGTTGLSHTLAGLTPQSSLSGSTFTGVANANGVAVFNVTLAQLNNLTGTLGFAGCLAGPTPCNAVIDVTGAGSFTQGFNYGGLTAAQRNLIWNFDGATSVTVNGVWWASILAPDANVENSAPINGNLIAQTIGATGSLGGELHFAPFDCSDNLCDAPPVPPVPEPGSLPLLGGALALFAVLASFAAIRRRGEPAAGGRRAL